MSTVFVFYLYFYVFIGEKHNDNVCVRADNSVFNVNVMMMGA